MVKKVLIGGLGVMLIVLANGCGKSEADKLDVAGAKVRYVALGARVRGLDPADIGDTTSSSVASQSYETLYQYHYLKHPYKLIPSLAAEMPESSEDGLTHIIKIRQDVYFSDDPCFPDGKGRQLKADDFIYAWKRIADIKNLSKNWWIFEGKIVGLDEFREYTQSVRSAKEVDYSREVEGLQALDDFTLQIKLNKPWPQMAYLLAHLPTAPMAREAVDHYGDQMINVTVGTGPFKLKSWQRGGRMVFARNPNFREEFYPTEGEPGDEERGLLKNAGQPLPFLDGIIFDMIEEDQPRWLQFMQGKIDAAGIPKDNYDQAIGDDRTLTPAMERKGIKLVIQEDPSTFWFGFNMDDPVVGKNLPLRRAMSLAFNRQQYIDIFTNGRAIPAKGMFPPIFKEYNEELNNSWAEFNPERARDLMKEAEEIHGGKITLKLSLPGTDVTIRHMGEFFRRMMDDIGLTIELEFFDWPTFQDRVNRRQVQIFSMGWIADFPDGQTFLQLFYSPFSSPGTNNFNYNNPEFDALYQKVEVMEESPERLEIYRRMEQMVVDDCPAVFLLHGVAFIPYYRYIENFKPNVFAYGTAKYIDIDLELRKELVGR